MARRRPILVLLSIAALALGALSSVTPAGTAESESAAGPVFESSGKAELVGRPSGPNVYTAGGIEKECASEQIGGTLNGRSETLELVPAYEECVARVLSGIPAKLVFWGCGYLLHDLEQASAGEWKASVDLTCPPGLWANWNLYESREDFSIGESRCVTKMPSQRNVGTAVIRAVPGDPDELSVRWKLTGIRYTVEGSSLLCGSVPDTVQHDASYTGAFTLGAKVGEDSFAAGGRPVDLRVSG